MTNEGIRREQSAAALELFQKLTDEEKAIYLERLRALVNKQAPAPDLPVKAG